ncbi:MAG TPA: hypothetical protein VK191_00345 [Symbiobacteriaceae bacterium]|nr:hypothetical protein [Symbiobacteriaceae bacterium]
MSQPPSNLPPGLSFARRTTAPVKLPRLDFPRLGGPMESQPARVGELAPEAPSATNGLGQQVVVFPYPETPPPATSAAPPVTNFAPPATSAAPPVTSFAPPPPFAQAIPLTGAPTAPVQLGSPASTITVKEEPPSMMTSSGATTSIPDAREAAKVIVYGRSGSAACMRAIQDLMERQISFQYVDVGRDQAAAAHLTAICNGEPVVPVIVYIGFAGA